METIYMILAALVGILFALMALLICTAAWELMQYESGKDGQQKRDGDG